MIRTLWQKRDRVNLWAWLRRLEDVMVHHMIQLADQHDFNEKQAAVNKANNVLLKALTATANQQHQRIANLEQSAGKDHVVHIYPGPFSDHGKEQC
jgi:hypothetical protein